jgi:D-glucosaminate-6-phosphate ammonia-lyase
MSSIYQRLGVPTIINAKGPSTRLSGNLLREEVARSMTEASQHCVDMAVLQARASEIIAAATGAEAGLSPRARQPAFCSARRPASPAWTPVG